MKLNKVLDGVKIPDNFKLYVNNYINESLKMMEEKGYALEFICNNKHVINTLKQKNIIWEAYYNDDFLVPCYYYCNPPSKNEFGEIIYIIHDNVYDANGFKVARPY